MQIPNASSQTAVSRWLHVRSFLVSLVVLLLVIFTLSQTGERVVQADMMNQETSLFSAATNHLMITPTPCSTPGSLDTSFNGTGKVITSFGNGTDYASSVAIQSDGRIVAAGSSIQVGGKDFAVVRYNSNGTLDTSFNGTGKVTTPIGSNEDYATSVAIQSDGRIVAAGPSSNGANHDFAVVRYNSNGTLDTSFNGTGKVTTPIGSNEDYATSVAIQSDGRIVVAGYSNIGSNYDFAVVRYNSNGTLDTSFNGTGKVTTPIGSSDDGAFSVAIQSDGRIVAAGASYIGSNGDFAVVRYNSNGTLDTSFNGTGRVTTPIGSSDDYAHSVAIQSDGRIVAAGPGSNGANYDFAVVRYNSNGTLDTSFNGTGKVTTPIGSSDDYAYSVAIQSDGRIVAAGDSYVGLYNDDFAVVRYNSNGTLDTSFNGTGKVTTPIGSGYESAYSVAIQSDGQIVAAGDSFNQGSDFAVVRYEGATCATDDTKLIPRDGLTGPTGPGINEPLENRIPVILIHGIHGNRREETNADSVDDPNYKYFENLVRYLNPGGAHNPTFKTYSFHYESDKHTTQEIAKALRDRIDETCEFGDKPIIIIAHSMGGIVARHYMLQTTNCGTYAGQPAGERVLKLITLATPHHGTYGANFKSRGDEFPNSTFANWVLGKLDTEYWRPNGCEACILHPEQVNRRSLLWDNYDSRLNLVPYPNETSNDIPNTINYPSAAEFYNNKIIAYYGEISPIGDPYWQLVKQAADGLSGPVAVINQCRYGSKDAQLACVAYFIDSVRLSKFNLLNIPPSGNDGLVPIESARFDGTQVMDRVHCSGYNHLQMEVGVGFGVQCEDGKFLFKSVRDRIIGKPVISPSLMVGPDRAGFGSHTYNVARPVGSAPVSTVDVPLSNLGDAALQITSLSLAGANADQFVIVNPPTLPLTIGAESSVQITVGFNPTSPGEKTAELRAENSSSNSVVVVNISATGVPEECDLNFSPENQFMPTSGGSGEVMIGNISCPWTVSAVDDWIHPTALADRVSFTVDANAAADVRYGTMIVSVYGRSYLYSISQDAKNVPCWLQLSSDQSVVQREAGGSSFYITAPNTCGWSFQSDSPWLVPSIETLNGSGSVGFTVADNFGLDRSGIITIQGAATSAQFTVHQRGASVAGTVTYGNAAAPPKYISNVTVAGAGSPNVSSVTDPPGTTAGQYLLTGFGAGSYTVSLSKTTGQNGINSFDAARIAQHVTGISLLTNDNQRVSADVTGNGNVTSQDAAKIAQVVTGLPFSPPNFTNTWRFFVSPGPTFPVGASPTSRTYSSIASNITGDDYVGLLIGEVTGNWTPSAARPAGRVESGKWKAESEDGGPVRSVSVELPTLTASSDKEIIVPVSVQGIAYKGVISYEFDLRYDASVMQPMVDPVDVKDTASRGLSVVTNAAEPGLLRVVVYGAFPIDENGVLLNLRFTAVGGAGLVSPISFGRIMFNEGEPRATVIDGLVEISASTGI